MNKQQYLNDQYMKRKFVIIASMFIIYMLIGITSNAQTLPMVGGELMYPSKNIVSNAVQSKEHTTLVAAVKAAGLVSTLQSTGPFTVFAPVNSAFDKLPIGTLETLLKPESKSMLTSILKYHVVAGKLNAKDIIKSIKAGNGIAILETAQGAKLTARMNGEMNVVIQDGRGNIANISTYDINQSNGIIHVIDAVLLP
jgi:uncharacterized surface protein with fasciclin (FAS1) repeats